MKIVFGALALLAVAIIFIKLLIPILLNMLFIIRVMAETYFLLSLEFKFVGMFFFLIILWISFSIVTNLAVQVFDLGYKLLKKEFEK